MSQGGSEGEPKAKTGRTARKPSPGKKKLDVVTWISLVSAATAIIAAVFAFRQVNIASQQDIEADQQQLLSLTTTIGQQMAQAAADGQPAVAPGATPTQAESSTQIVQTAELTAEGEAAAVLINKLKGNGVAGIEYIEAGEALVEGDDTAQAMAYFKDAVNAPPYAAGTRASALRSEAFIYYELNRPVIGHHDMMLAVKIYRNRHLELTQGEIDNSIAQSYLYDAEQQLDINGCKIAAADIKAATKVLSPIGTGGTNVTNKRLLVLDALALVKRCEAPK